MIQLCQNTELQPLHNNNGLSILAAISLSLYKRVRVHYWLIIMIIDLRIAGQVPDTWARLNRNVELLGANFDVCHAFCAACGA